VENIVERRRSQMTTWRMRNGCWVPKATNAHTDGIILSFPLQERASMFRYAYTAYLVINLTEGKHLEAPRVDGSIILKKIFGK
jgi:hypothetical protein